ncbi:EAL domain-containing protein [Nautilia sp.]
MNILKKINYAIKKNNVISLFQPIVDNKSKKTVKYESLVRIIDEEGNMLSPFHFLDIAKKAGLYGEIGIRVLENTFMVYENKNVSVTINISPNDIMKDFITERIYELLDSHKPKKGAVTFEILEDEIIQFPSMIKNFVDKVKNYDVQIAIDDFGSGYSNFSRIMELNADIIKIDGSLIKDIDTDKTKQVIVESIVNFAKKENKLTVAEFVENEAIYSVLTKLGVDYSQGYYFSKPLREEEI